jgi:hypothetical protein
LLKNIANKTYGKNGSFIDSDNPDDDSARSRVIMPYMTQKPSHQDSKGTIHWGLKRSAILATRGAFYVDFVTPKGLTYKVSSKATTDNSGEDENAEDVESNPFKELVDQTYIILDMNLQSNSGNHYRLEISTLRPPTFYQMVQRKPKEGEDGGSGTSETVTRPEVLSTWDGVDSTTLLQGDKEGRLRLTFENFLNYLMITDNVNGGVWVIHKSMGKPPSNTNAEDENGDSAVNRYIQEYFTIGGQLTVYGGNISAAVSFCHMNYEKEASLRLKNFYATGQDRQALTRFYYGTDDIGVRDASSVLPEFLVDGRYYGSFAGRIDGTVLHETPFVNGNDFSQINSVVTNANSPTPFRSKMRTIINLTSGTFVNFGEGYNLGYCTTPLLRYCVQEYPKIEVIASRDSSWPCARIKELTISREVEGIHAASSKGSMTLNALNDVVGVEGLDEIKNSIAKSSYIKIDAEFVGGLLDGQSTTVFTGIAHNVSDMTKAGERTLVFELTDYWRIFDHSVVLNSPYFDGEPYDTVVRYWADYCGFFDSGISIPQTSAFLGISIDNDSPLTKFQDMMNISEVIKKLAKQGHHIAYFDSVGNFIYRDAPTVVLSGQANVPVASFVTSHENVNENVRPFGPYSGIAAYGDVEDEYIAYQVRNMSWDVSSIINQIIIMSVAGYKTNDTDSRDIILKSDTNFPSITDPNAEGYLGYIKPLIQHESLFGDESSVQRALRLYTRFYRPAYEVSWKTIGGLGLAEVEVFDLVRIDGMDVIVQTIEHTFNAETQTWDIDWKGEWIYPPNNRMTDTGGDGSGGN